MDHDDMDGIEIGMGVFHGKGVGKEKEDGEIPPLSLGSECL
jgi:hypothetical protein